MATYRAIAATSSAIIQVLRDARPAASLPTGTEFGLFGATQFREPPFDVGVSLYLVRVEVSQARRSLPARLDPRGQRYRPPLPLDLHYLLCAWHADPALQQELLGWAMRQLEDVSILPAGLLNEAHPGGLHFHSDEAVELVCEGVSLADLTSLWDVMKPNIPLAAGYVARMIPIESTVVLDEAGPVQTREFDYAGAPS